MICMPELTPDRLWPRLAEVLDTWQRNFPFRLILASGSHGRRYLMEQAGYTFRS